MKKLVLIPVVALAAVMALAVPAGATNGGSDVATPTAQTSPTSLDPPSEADRTFLIAAARVGLAEILQGTVASQRGVDPEVREHGTEMIDDHFGQILQQLPIHLVFGVPVPATTPDQDAQLFALLAEPEASFDVAYLTAQVTAHEQAVELFRAAAAEADNVFVKAFASQQLPVLEMHLTHAEELLAGQAQPVATS